MKILLSGTGYMAGSIADKEDSGDLVEFPLMSDIDVSLDDEYYGSFDCDDEEYDDEMKVRIMPYVKENCLVKTEPPYFFRMVYGGGLVGCGVRD